MRATRDVIQVIQLGPSPAAKGGVASVIADLLKEHGKDPDLSVRAIPTTLAREHGLATDVLVSAAALGRAFWACLKRPRPVLHLHFTPRGSAFRKGIVVRMARLFGVPCLIHDHSVEEGYRDAGKFMKFWMRSSLARVNVIVVLSEREKRFLGSLVNTRVEVVPNGIELCEESEQSRRVADEPARFLFVGGQMRRKGVFDLVEAFARLCKDGLTAQLTIAGHDDSGEISRRVTEHHLENCVQMPGWVVGDAKKKILQESSVFVLPSHREGMPLAILEAMSFGLPVIVSTVGGIPETVVEGETGLLVEPGDIKGLAEAMKRLALDPGLRRRFGQAGRKRAEERFSLQAAAARLKQIYGQLAGRRPGP